MASRFAFRIGASLRTSGVSIYHPASASLGRLESPSNTITTATLYHLPVPLASVLAGKLPRTHSQPLRDAIPTARPRSADRRRGDRLFILLLLSTVALPCLAQPSPAQPCSLVQIPVLLYPGGQETQSPRLASHHTA